MTILGIETSCDDTAVAVLDISPDEITVRANVVSSQVTIHAPHGGVVPNLAAREHEKNLGHVLELTLQEAKMSEIDLIAVTRGPGLAPALWVGLNFAKALAKEFQKPIIGVNHMEGHIYSNWLKPVGENSKSEIRNPEFPILNLIVSGGHTELVLMRDHSKYELIGETKDDAVGEAFDKIARLLGLGYPGGPLLEELAAGGNSSRYPLPRPMLHSKDFNFSYAGLKTAALYLLRDLEKDGPSPRPGQYHISDQQKSDIASSFQKAAIEPLVQKTIRAAREFKVNAVYLSGGVSANKSLREGLEHAAKEIGLAYSQPLLEYTGDNAAMIALAGYFNYQRFGATELETLEADANLKW